MSSISLTNAAALPPLSTGSPNPKTNLQTYFKERNAEVRQLNQALQSGDIATAQQDYNNIVALGNSVIHRDNPFFRADRGLDFNAIGGALQNGDLAGAKQAFAALQSTYKHTPAQSTPATPATSGNGVNITA